MCGVKGKPATWKFEPIGTRDMTSTPPPMATSTTPAAMRFAAKWMACWPGPHWRSCVVAFVSRDGAVIHSKRRRERAFRREWVNGDRAGLWRGDDDEHRFEASQAEYQDVSRRSRRGGARARQSEERRRLCTLRHCSDEHARDHDSGAADPGEAVRAGSCARGAVVGDADP